MKKLLLSIFLILGITMILGFVSAQNGDTKIFHIDDRFKVGWTDGADNYEAEYKVWKIEEQNGVNITILVDASTGSIAIHSLNGLTHSLGASSKLIINQIYVSGDDKWISITLENAQFKESTTAPTSPSSGGGGGGSSSETSCEKYYECLDGQEVQYCQLIKQYDANGNVIGAGCGCKANPEELCTAPSSGGGGSTQTNITPISSGGGGRGSGNNETPIICNGCVLGDKCVPIGYRKDGNYCDLNSELKEQNKANSQCENSFECNSNLCIDNKCVSGSVWAKFMRWFSRLFG